MDKALLRGELEFLKDEHLWRPVANDLARAATETHLPSRVIICDETLREGEETPGVDLNLAGRTRIANKLAEVGIPEIEVGYVGAIAEHADFSRHLKREGNPCKLVSHTRTYTQAHEWKAEIDRAVDAGSDVLCLLAQASETLAATTPWLPLAEVAERCAEAIEYTQSLGVVPALSLVDTVRTPIQNILDVYRVAAEAGVKRVYVMDGQGVALPETIFYLVRAVRDVVGPDVEIAVHCHDDYGLASANTLAGVRAGAEVVDTVVNGLGDKAGIGATEEVAMALEVLYNVPTGVRLEELYSLSKLVEEIFQIPIEMNKAIVGENIVRHQIDSHLNTLIRGIWWAWESMKPEFFGRQRSLEWAAGKLRTGRSGSIAAKMSQMGITPTEAQWEQVMNRLRAEVEQKRVLTEPEVERLIRQACA